MSTDRAVNRMSSDRVAMSPIVDRMTDTCEKHSPPLRSVSIYAIPVGCSVLFTDQLILSYGIPISILK